MMSRVPLSLSRVPMALALALSPCPFPGPTPAQLTLASLAAGGPEGRGGAPGSALGIQGGPGGE